ncbi:MAG: hypothetical protein Q7K71_04120 [Candidatus Omnitrophota bacterium]|nr:hypothetical protein [Candidatus Omnitrophota bacterium]
MLTYFSQKRGQSTLEYAVLTVIIIGALLSIQFYIKRGVQGRLKSAADDIGDQYSVGNTNVIKTTNTSSTSRETFGVDGQGVSATGLIGPETTNTSERSVIVNTEQEYMGR